VCGSKYRCTLGSGLKFRLYSGYGELNSCESLAFLYTEGNNPFELSEKCTEYGLELLGRGYLPRTQRRYPELFEYLGWCSWDALQIRIGTDGLLKKCMEFKEKDIPVKWVLLDDMWAEVKGLNDAKYETFSEMVGIMHQSKLSSFEADPVRFPGGLKDCIDKIKEEYQLKVGMWHPTTGYWFGIDPESELADKYRDLLTESQDGRLIPNPQLDKLFIFYNAFHTFLKGCGTDFVKIDNQSFIRNVLKGIIPAGEAAANLHQAIESSVGSNFDNNLINCMGMAQENMWNRPTSAISRCSDDFLSENRGWFIKHITQCSYNSFVQGQFLWCDWDMWWTDDGQALKNSVLRALSGGPVYVSDKLGRSIKEILEPLLFSDGRILRCDNPAMPSKDCLTVNPENTGKPFKVWNKCGNSGVLAVFNLDNENKPVFGSVSIKDIDRLEGDKFAVYEHFNGELVILTKEESIKITLKDQDEFCLYLIVPVDNGIANIGLINKFISMKAIINTMGQSVLLYEGGKYAFYSEKGIEKTYVNGIEYNFERKNNLYIVDCAEVKENTFITFE